jgi:hypothetical protein
MKFQSAIAGLALAAVVSLCYAASPGPTPTPQPKPLIRKQACPAGTTGTWTQTEAYVRHIPPPPFWAPSGVWLPATPPAGACKPSGGLVLIQGMTDVTPEATLPRPTKSTPSIEPHWGTTLQDGADVADVATDPHGGHPSWIATDYSRHEAFNADNTKYFLPVSSGFWALYDFPSRSFEKWLPNLAGDAEPQWSTTDPNKLFYIAINGTSRQLYSQDVRTGVQTIEGDLGPKMDLITECAGTTAAYTKAEGSPSTDMRYWAFIGSSGNSFDSKCLIVWDNQTKTIVGHMPTGGDNPDHISMTPDGRYVVPSWDSSKGTRAYRPDFSAFTRVHHKSEHSDLGVLANGHAFYISEDYQANAGDVFWVDIDAQTFLPANATTVTDAVRTNLFPTYFNPLDNYTGGATGAFHFSAKAWKKPGRVGVGCYGDGADRNGVYQWFHKRLFAVDLNHTPAVIYQIATTHDSGHNASSYEDETHMSFNNDATLAIFNSDWGTPTNQGIMPTIIQLPLSAIP